MALQTTIQSIDGRHEAELKLLITSLSAPNDIVPLPSSNRRAWVPEPNFWQELSTLIHKNI
jgi:hypothetical protein